MVGRVTNHYARFRADRVTELDRYDARRPSSSYCRSERKKRRNCGRLLEEKEEPDSLLSPSSGPRRQGADDRTGASHLRIKLEDRLSSLLRLKSPNCVQEQKTPSSSGRDCPSRPAKFPKRVSYRSGRLVTSPNTTDHDARKLLNVLDRDEGDFYNEEHERECLLLDFSEGPRNWPLHWTTALQGSFKEEPEK